MDALDVVLPGLDVTQMVPDDITQSLLNERIDQQNMADWRNGASPSERVHLQAYSAKGSGHEVSLVPSKTLDTYLTPSEFVNTVSRRLGVDVMDSGRPCCFCGHHLDAQGSHSSHVWRGETLPRCTMGSETFTSISVSVRG